MDTKKVDLSGLTDEQAMIIKVIIAEFHRINLLKK